MLTDPAGHVPVLADEVMDLLSPRGGQTVVDATLGLGGHARLLAEAIGPTGTLVGFDVDPANLETARDRLSSAPCSVRVMHGNFAELADGLAELGIKQVDVILADLGVSSTQLDEGDRGFSFLRDGPLDMRMDPRLTETAADLVNRLKERPLGDLIYYNAQETASRKIARYICEVRRSGRITRTSQLAQVVADALRVNPDSRRTKIHPATKTFQALRMAVNNEIGCLESLLAAAPGLLRPDGRIGIIAFHSGEDKPVKLDFRKRKGEGVYELLTKRPVVASEQERATNPRSRSAKLRVARRLPTATHTG